MENTKLKRNLEAANERMLTVLQTVTSGIIALSRSAEVMLINPAARHMLGGTSTEVPFRNDNSQYHVSDKLHQQDLRLHPRAIHVLHTDSEP